MTQRTVLVDVDGTLIKGPSSESRLIRWLAARGELGLRQWLAALFFFLRYALRFGRHTAARNKAYLAGKPVALLQQLGVQFVQQELLQHLHPPMVQRLQAHIRQGDRVLLLTGTPVFVAQPLAEHLAVKEIIAMQPASANGRYLARPALVHPLGNDKPALTRQYGIDLAGCVAYADSVHDVALLQQVATPVAVMPDKSLAAVAKRLGWEVLGRLPA